MVHHCGTQHDALTHMVPDGKPRRASADCFIVYLCRVLNVPYPVISERRFQELNVQPGERILPAPTRTENTTNMRVLIRLC